MLQETSYLQQLHAEHKARQRRIAASSHEKKTEAELKAAQAERIRQAEIAAEQRKEARAKAREKAQWQAFWRHMLEEDIEPFEEKPKNTMAAIVAQVAEKYGVTVNELKSLRRTRGPLIQARFEACWRCRRETRFSTPQIGRAIGGRDHTTVLHAISRYDAMRNQIATGEPAYSTATRNASFIPELVIVDG